MLERGTELPLDVQLLLFDDENEAKLEAHGVRGPAVFDKWPRYYRNRAGRRADRIGRIGRRRMGLRRAAGDGVPGNTRSGSPVPKGDPVMAGQDTNHNPELDVGLGEQVDAAPRTRAKNALVAVRLPGELLERVDAYARTNGLTVSGVLRQGAERLVSGSIDTGPFIVSSTILVTGAAQLQALPSGGMGRSEQISGVSDDRPELTLAG